MSSYRAFQAVTQVQTRVDHSEKLRGESLGVSRRKYQAECGTLGDRATLAVEPVLLLSKGISRVKGTDHMIALDNACQPSPTSTTMPAASEQVITLSLTGKGY
jgi:hypothetical protein